MYYYLHIQFNLFVKIYYTTYYILYPISEQMKLFYIPTNINKFIVTDTVCLDCVIEIIILQEMDLNYFPNYYYFIVI